VNDSLGRINIRPRQLKNLALAHSCVDRTNQHWSNAFTLLATCREQALFFVASQDSLAVMLVCDTNQCASTYEWAPDNPSLSEGNIKNTA